MSMKGTASQVIKHTATLFFLMQTYSFQTRYFRAFHPYMSHGSNCIISKWHLLPVARGLHSRNTPPGAKRALPFP